MNICTIIPYDDSLNRPVCPVPPQPKVREAWHCTYHYRPNPVLRKVDDFMSPLIAKSPRRGACRCRCSIDNPFSSIRFRHPTSCSAQRTYRSPLLHLVMLTQTTSMFLGRACPSTATINSRFYETNCAIHLKRLDIQLVYRDCVVVVAPTTLDHRLPPSLIPYNNIGITVVRPCSIKPLKGISAT